MVTLDKSSLVGKGLHRECYKHPENENLCIKVTVHGNNIESLREIKYYKHLEKRDVPLDMIPRYYGEIETNLGKRSVFDLVMDYNDTVSKTLVYYFSSDDKTDEHYNGLSESLYFLKDYLLRHQIITLTLNPKNIACQKINVRNFRLFIIDNIGNSDFIPICNYSKYFAQKKILRKWNRFEKNILNKYKQNKVLHRMLT
jgi:hypothetical protein